LTSQVPAGGQVGMPGHRPAIVEIGMAAQLRSPTLLAEPILAASRARFNASTVGFPFRSRSGLMDLVFQTIPCIAGSVTYKRQLKRPAMPWAAADLIFA
jgi:hypothetical protein